MSHLLSNSPACRLFAFSAPRPECAAVSGAEGEADRHQPLIPFLLLSACVHG